MSAYHGYIDSARTKLREADATLRTPDDLTPDELRTVIDEIDRALDYLAYALEHKAGEQPATDADETQDLPLAQERG